MNDMGKLTYLDDVSAEEFSSAWAMHIVPGSLLHLQASRQAGRKFSDDIFHGCERRLKKLTARYTL